MQITITYDPDTETLSTDPDSYAGTTGDNVSTTITISGLNDLVGWTADLVFPIVSFSSCTPTYPMARLSTPFSYLIPNSLISLCTDGILPIQLRLTKDEAVKWSRNILRINVSRIVDAVSAIDDAFPNLALLKGDSNEWMPSVVYSKGAVVVFGGHVFISLQSNNKGIRPDYSTTRWMQLLEVKEYRETIGDGVKTDFMIRHGLNTYDVCLSITNSTGTIDLTDFVYDVSILGRDVINITTIGPLPADSILRVDKSYRLINNDLRIRGDIDATGATLGSLTISSSDRINLSNRYIGVDSSGTAFAGTYGQTKALAKEESLNAHIVRSDNPHGVTKTQIELDRVDNTTDLEKCVSLPVRAELDLKADAADVVYKNQLIASGTHTKITYDEKGLIVSGADLSGADIPPHSADLLTSGTVADERITYLAERIYRKTSVWTPVPSDDRYPTEKIVKDSLDKKVDITEGVEQWMAGITYSSGAITNVGGTLYASLVSNNKGNDPDLSPGKWMKYTASSASDPALQDAYVTTIGDGVSTSITVTHSLDSEDVIVSLYSMAGDKPTIDSYVVRDNENQITIQFSVAPASNSVRVMVSRPGTSVRSVNGYQGDVILDPDDIGAVSSNHPITAGTKTKISYDTQGLVTVGEDLLASDIPNLNASKITAGTFDVARIPISKFVWTITGDGVTDEFTAAHLLGGSPLLIQMADSAGRIVDAAMEATATDLSVSMTTPPAVGTTYSITAIRW